MDVPDDRLTLEAGLIRGQILRFQVATDLSDLIQHVKWQLELQTGWRPSVMRLNFLGRNDMDDAKSLADYNVGTHAKILVQMTHGRDMSMTKGRVIVRFEGQDCYDFEPAIDTGDWIDPRGDETITPRELVVQARERIVYLRSRGSMSTVTPFVEDMRARVSLDDVHVDDDEALLVAWDKLVIDFSSTGAFTKAASKGV